MTLVVREAAPADRQGVLNVIDGAALAVDAERVARAIDRGDVLVAADDGPILGALVLDGAEITAIAVRRRRRGQGIGTQLVERAATRRESLVAEFEENVRLFWESVGFAIEPSGESDRYRGER